MCIEKRYQHKDTEWGNRIGDERRSRQYKTEITYVRVRPGYAPQDDRSSSLVSAAADIVGTRN